MTLSEIQNIAVPAAKACAAAANHPGKRDLRERLYDALGPVANLRSVDDTTYPAHFLQLLRQTAVWAYIVRCRIENSRNSIVSTPVGSIQYPARDLQQLLVQLVGELEHRNSTVDRRPGHRKFISGRHPVAHGRTEELQ